MTTTIKRQPMIGAFKDELSETDRKALTIAIQVLTDEWFDDVESRSVNWITMWMPDAYEDRYTQRFIRDMIVSLGSVAAKLCNADGFTGLSCVAEELCLSAIIREATADHMEEAHGCGLSEEGASVLYDLAFEDLDFEMLFRQKMEGFAQSPAGRYMGIAFLDFEDWFESFGGQCVGPYVAGDKAFIDDSGDLIDMRAGRGELS